MEALRAAGMEVSRISDRLTITETDEAKNLLAGIRNRGGEALGAYLQGPEAKGIKAVDLRTSGIYDNGVAHICMSSRVLDRLEELRVGNVGHYGLEYLLMAARRSSNLKILELQVKDVPTLHMNRQTLASEDFDTAEYNAMANAEEDGGGEGEEGGETPAEKLARIAKKMQENDYDSDEEREKEQERKRAAREKKGHGRKKETGEEEGAGEEEEEQKKETGPSAALLALLSELVDIAQEKTQMSEITVGGECPAIVMYELRRVVEQHAQKRSGTSQESDRVDSHSAAAALALQMEELSKELEAGSGPGGAPGPGGIGGSKKSGGLIADLDDLAMDDMDRTSLDIRMYVNRRLFAVLGEALFECQRYKSKENDAVSKPGGEMAFLATYIRQAQARLEEEQKNVKKSAS